MTREEQFRELDRLEVEIEDAYKKYKGLKDARNGLINVMMAQFRKENNIEEEGIERFRKQNEPAPKTS